MWFGRKVEIAYFTYWFPYFCFARLRQITMFTHTIKLILSVRLTKHFIFSLQSNFCVLFSVDHVSSYIFVVKINRVIMRTNERNNDSVLLLNITNTRYKRNKIERTVWWYIFNTRFIRYLHLFIYCVSI